MTCRKHAVQAPAPSSVVSSASVRGIDVGDLGVLHAGGAGHDVENAAACRGEVDVGVAARCSSLGGAAVFAVPPWLHWVEVYWHLLTGMVLPVL